MREMGEGASVPIEPPEQTKLLDVCVTQAGVIGGGIPGGECAASLFAVSFDGVAAAGGYDAIWLLVTDPLNCDEHERPLRRVEYVWKSWKDMSVTPLATTEGVTKGAAVEDVESVPGLKEAISLP
jgi:phosphomevalonate kinase